MISKLLYKVKKQIINLTKEYREPNLAQKEVSPCYSEMKR